jgi:hypothetical protein
MADQYHVAPTRHVTAHFPVYLGDQGAGRIEHVEPAPCGLRLDGPRNTVRGEDDCRSVRHLVEFVNEHRPAILETVDYRPIVNNLVANIHGAAAVECELHDTDRPFHSRAEAAGVRQQDCRNLR